MSPCTLRSCFSKLWLWRTSHSVTLSPASPAAYRYDGDLACDACFFLKWDEDATSEPTDTLAGLLVVSKQLERTATWVATWMRLLGLLFFPFFSLSSLVAFD